MGFTRTATTPDMARRGLVVRTPAALHDEGDMIDAEALQAAGFTFVPDEGRGPGKWERLHGTCPSWWRGKWESAGGSVGDRAIAVRFFLNTRRAVLRVLPDNGGEPAVTSEADYDVTYTIDGVLTLLIDNMTDAACEARRQMNL